MRHKFGVISDIATVLDVAHLSHDTSLSTVMRYGINTISPFVVFWKDAALDTQWWPRTMPIEDDIHRDPSILRYLVLCVWDFLFCLVLASELSLIYIFGLIKLYTPNTLFF